MLLLFRPSSLSGSTAIGSCALLFLVKRIKRGDSPQQKSPADLLQDDGQLPWNCFSDPLGHISDLSDTTVAFHSVGAPAFARASGGLERCVLYHIASSATRWVLTKNLKLRFSIATVKYNAEFTVAMGKSGNIACLSLLSSVQRDLSSHHKVPILIKLDKPTLPPPLHPVVHILHRGLAIVF